MFCLLLLILPLVSSPKSAEINMDYMAPRINYQSLLVGQETESRSASYEITRICFNTCIEQIEIKEVWLEYGSCHFQATLNVLL